MKKIYCLSGIGADERIFCNLSVNSFELVHLPWIPPQKEETLPHYALRMAALIPEPDPIILGLSFGGMLATEIAKAMPVKKAILISSAKTENELPAINSMVSALLRWQVLPSFMFSVPNAYVCRLFGAKTKDEAVFLSNIIRNADGAFVKWASRAIINWQNTVVPPSILHIHGTEDKVIPSGSVRPHHWVEGGTHLMIYNRAAEISTIISRELSFSG